MKCFYHADNDGKCAGFWVYNSATNYDNYGREFIQINYGTKFPFDIIHPNEQVFIVDYSIEVEEMRRLLEITKDITWIDHHKTAIEKYSDFEIPIRGIRYDGIAACMLTYCWLEHMTLNGIGEPDEFDLKMTSYAPIFTKLIADWDVWTFKYGDATRKFNMGFELFEKSPENEIWSMLNNDEHVDEIINKGIIITKYRDNWAKEYCETKGFDIEFEGYKCFAINIANCNSEYFKSINEFIYDIFITFCFNGSIWTYSLYSEKVDVSEIAKKYGGGGHKCASGFSTKELILMGD